jgi:ATP dependent DNA ligase domain
MTRPKSRMLQHTLPAGFIPPCLPTKTDKLPSGSEWLHEIKHDGFRIIARKNRAQVQLYSRPGNDLTYRFPLIVPAHPSGTSCPFASARPAKERQAAADEQGRQGDHRAASIALARKRFNLSFLTIPRRHSTLGGCALRRLWRCGKHFRQAPSTTARPNSGLYPRVSSFFRDTKSFFVMCITSRTQPPR